MRSTLFLGAGYETSLLPGCWDCGSGNETKEGGVWGQDYETLFPGTGLGLSIVQYMEKAGQWEGLQNEATCWGAMYHDERKWCVILKCDLEV